MADLRKAAKRKLGASGIAIAPIGLGCMSFSGVYGPSDDEAAIRFIGQAVDEYGIDFLDSSDMYGWGHNEQVVGKALKGRRDKVVLATKFGQTQNPGGPNGVDGRPEYVMQACEASLKRLRIDVIDVYFQHRIDPKVPIEDTMGAMKRLVEQGKVRSLALSEASPETIRRAHKVHPIACVQSEYSLLYREQAEAAIATTRPLGISFIAYSPLGRSLLTGALTSLEGLPQGDGRLRHPRFAGDNLGKNLTLVQKLQAIADEKRCKTSQLVLAWVLAQGDDIVPIPGTKRLERLEENLGALDVTLSAADIERITDAVPVDAVAGTRYPEGQMKSVFV